MNKLIEAIDRLNSLTIDLIQEEPKKEDYKELGDYMFARTTFRRFPKQLNGGALECFFSNQKLNQLWSWADGEKGTDFLLPRLKFLSQNESKDIVNSVLLDAENPWYHSKVPIFSASEGGDIYMCTEDEKIYFIDFDDHWNYLLSDSLESFLNFLSELVEYSKDSSKPIEFSLVEGNEQYLSLAKKVGAENFYPFIVDETTKFES